MRLCVGNGVTKTSPITQELPDESGMLMLVHPQNVGVNWMLTSGALVACNLRQAERRTETEANLQGRLDSQQESIDLQLKLFLHEADGLGLFRPEDSLDLPPAGNIGRQPQNDPFNGSLPAGNIVR